MRCGNITSCRSRLNDLKGVFPCSSVAGIADFIIALERCESREIVPEVESRIEDAMCDLLEDGLIHELCVELNLPDDNCESGERIAEFFKKHLRDSEIHVHIRDDLSFCCNAWE